MKFVRWIPAIAGVALLAGCHGIGSGSTVEKIKIIYFPVTGDQGALLTTTNDPGNVTTDTIKMYDCFCSTVKVYGYFTDGTVGDFTTRATLTSSNSGIVEVSRFQAVPCAALQSDPSVWTLQPKGTPGTATLSAEFLGLKATMAVRVDPTSAGTFTLAPSDTSNTGQVAVGLPLPLQLTATLDNRLHFVTNNVTTWTFPGDPNNTMATIVGGVVSGVAPTGASPLAVKPVFGSCPSFDPLASNPFSVSVGDIVPPLLLAEQDNFTTDHKIAPNSTESLKVTAPLDFRDGNGTTGAQVMSTFTQMTYTDICDKYSHDDAADPTGAAQTCKLDAATVCASTVKVCAPANPPTACALTMAPCRTAASPVVAGLFNNIIGKGDNGNPTSFTANYPLVQGTATTLAADIADGTTTSISVTELKGYPSTFPWFGVIDQNGTREDVRVTAATGTGPVTLTVVRGQNNTTAQAHANPPGGPNLSFNQRAYTSDPNAPLQVTGKSGTLQSLAIDPPGTFGADGLLRLTATGTFDDATDADPARQQNATVLLTIASGSPTVVWTSSNTAVAAVGSNSGVAAQTTICGGRVSIRARATTSTDETTKTFNTTDATNPGNCGTTDPLCSQVNLCIATPTTLPEGTTCTTTTTCP